MAIIDAGFFAARAFGALIVDEYLKVVGRSILDGQSEIGLTETGAGLQNRAQLGQIGAVETQDGARELV